MNFGRILAFVQIGVSICAAIGYLSVKDFWRGLYWASAAVLTLAVTMQ